MTQRVGYTRVLGDGTRVASQIDVLTRIRCDRVFVDRSPANVHPGSEWLACVRSLEAGDLLIVPSLEHLGFTLEQLGVALTQVIERGSKLEFFEWHRTIPLDLEVFRDLVTRLDAFERFGRRELTNAGLSAAKSEGRVGGRPHKLGPDQLAELRKLMGAPGADATEIGRYFGISRAAVYKNLKRSVG